MISIVRRYLSWLHLQWPAGHVEKLPVTGEAGATNLPGVYVSGDLRGIPLLKFSTDTGARAVQTILADSAFKQARDASARDGGGETLDLVIIGAGVSGMAAALEARSAGLSFTVVEANEPFSTIVNFPKGKPIYTYPKDMSPAGTLSVTAPVKEPLLEELRAQTIDAGITPLIARAERIRKSGGRLQVDLDGLPPLKALRVIAALGRSGNFRALGVPGEHLDKVYNRLHDPQDFCEKNVLIVGGGDSALETAIALGSCGSAVTLSYRNAEFSRPKPENIEMVRKLAADGGADVAVKNPTSERVTTASGKFIQQPPTHGRVELIMESAVKEIRETEVVLAAAGGGEETIPNDVVFSMIGREAPLDFFRRSGIAIAGEWTRGRIAGFAAFFLFCVALYNWKSHGALGHLFQERGWFPFALTEWFAAAAASPHTFAGTLVKSAASPSFWYTLAYSFIVVLFGIRRIRKRNTPYIAAQTSVLMLIQVVPLFLLPEIILPLLGHNGLLPHWLTSALFPAVEYGHGYEFWRAYGLILAWPLNVYNVFTGQPLGWWLALSFLQTAVFIPALIYFWGKGAYCGWVCSCGALAETLGDGQRHKMPHGAGWNRLNSIGQAILAIAVIMLVIRIIGWLQPGNAALNHFFDNRLTNYKWIVDVFLAGAIGYGAYFWLSGRVWCRFMCPLAALMHIYARFSRFRILPDKKKCISCNLCTSVCHQGIDIMNFANKGIPMKDPECVRCSACVHVCPTGVLTFGRVNARGETIATDRLAASPAQMREGR